jgi:hypothetical protein
VVLLRKSFPQKTNLQTAAELNVTWEEVFGLCKPERSKKQNPKPLKVVHKKRKTTIIQKPEAIVIGFFSYILVPSVETFSQENFTFSFGFSGFRFNQFLCKVLSFRRVGLHWKAKQRLSSRFGKFTTKTYHVTSDCGKKSIPATQI